MIVNIISIIVLVIVIIILAYFTVFNFYQKKYYVESYKPKDIRKGDIKSYPEEYRLNATSRKP